MAGRGSGDVTPNVVNEWARDFEAMWNRVDGCFSRRDTRARARQYVQGLLGRMERKNGWQLAEYLGNPTPYALQHLIARATWSADRLRDDLRRYVRTHLIASEKPGVLIVDETGFLKKGEKSVGVQRQYSGTAGRIENSQVGVFLAVAGPRGRALIDRELYLGKSWCDDASRRRVAGIPEEVAFATKQRLAQRMLARALDDGFSPSWVLADEVYGSDSKFRCFLEERGQPYVLAVSSQQRLWVELRQKRVDAIAREIPAKRWKRISAGSGLKGPRVYDWAVRPTGIPTEEGLRRWVLFRRSVGNPEEVAYYFCLAPAKAKLGDLASAAGQRWGIECCFEAAKQESGLDEYEVRSWDGWYRHITFSMLALAFLSVVRSCASEGDGGKKGAPALSR